VCGIFLGCVFFFSPAHSADTPPNSAPANKKPGTKKTPIRIISDNMISYKEKNMVSFLDNVIAYKENMTIYSDQLDVYSDKKQNELKKIIAIGHVKIIKKDMVGTCEKAIYEESEKTLTMLGNPVVVKEDNVIEGSKIVYYQEDDNIVAHSDQDKKVEVTLFPEQLEKAKESNEKKEN